MDDLIVNEYDRDLARQYAFKTWKRRLTARDVVWVQTYKDMGFSTQDAIDTLFYDSQRLTTNDPKWDQERTNQSQ